MSLTIQQWKDTKLLPTSGMIAWHQYEAAVSGNEIIYDYSGNGNDISNVATNAPVLTANVFNGHPAWYFNGTTTIPLRRTLSCNPKHIFILASNDEATFSQYRGLISGRSSGDGLVTDTVGSSKWLDLGLGADFIYKKTDVLYANSDLQAPINGDFALMEVKSAAGLNWDGIQIGRHKTNATYLHKGYWVEHIIYDRVLTEAEQLRVKLYFNLKFALYRDSFPLYFPSDNFIDLKRRRFYAEPPMYGKITDSFEFEDGGRTFNEVADNAPRRWEYDYIIQNSVGTATDPGEVRLFDEFYDQIRLARSFNFTDKYGTTWDNVRIESYDRDHDKHKPWRQTVKFKLVRYP